MVGTQRKYARKLDDGKTATGWGDNDLFTIFGTSALKQAMQAKTCPGYLPLITEPKGSVWP